MAEEGDWLTLTNISTSELFATIRGSMSKDLRMSLNILNKCSSSSLIASALLRLSKPEASFSISALLSCSLLYSNQG